MQLSFDVFCVWYCGPALCICLANGCRGENVIACEVGHYGNSGLRGFGEDHPVILTFLSRII